MKVVKMRSIPKSDLIDRLEEILGQAKDGKIQGAAFVLLDDGFTVTVGWSGVVQDNPCTSAGGAAILQSRLVDLAREQCS